MNLIFASNNQHKTEEIKNILAEKYTIKSLSDLNFFEDIPETATTIEGNALLKADFVSKKFNRNCFADDTGLEVEVLDGAPGVYSARYAGEHKNSEDNIDKLLENLKDKTNRKAHFKTVICLIINHEKYFFEGIVTGKILHKRQGEKGFGYDAIFMPDGYQKSFAELSLEEKNTISHRSLAVKKLVEFLENT